MFWKVCGLVKQKRDSEFVRLEKMDYITLMVFFKKKTTATKNFCKIL